MGWRQAIETESLSLGFKFSHVKVNMPTVTFYNESETRSISQRTPLVKKEVRDKFPMLWVCWEEHKCIFAFNTPHTPDDEVVRRITKLAKYWLIDEQPTIQFLSIADMSNLALTAERDVVSLGTIGYNPPGKQGIMTDAKV